MFNRIRSTLTAIVLLSASAGAYALGDAAPGKLLTGKAVYDEKRYALLYPASLFDMDNTPSVFRLGLVWDERNGDEMRFIVNLPISEQVTLADLQKSAETFAVQIDGKPEKLSRVRNSIERKQTSGAFSTTYEAEMRYTGSKQLIDKMLSAGKVEFSMTVLLKKYQAGLKVNNKKDTAMHDKDYTAINGMKRFRHAAWGDAK